MVTIFRGPFQSGKSGLILSKIRDELSARRFPLLLVPSRIQRDTFTARLALGGSPTAGYAGKVIYTLSESMNEVLSRIPEEHSVISDFESFILFKLILEENRKKLSYFRDLPPNSGVLKMIYSVITQLRAGLLLQGGKDLLAGHALRQNSAKWKDIELLFSEYENRLTKSRLSDANQLFIQAASSVREAGIPGKSLLAVDGFTDFMASQFEYLKSVIHSFEKQELPVFFSLTSTVSPVIQKTLDTLKKEFELNFVDLPGNKNPISELSHAILDQIPSAKKIGAPVQVIRSFGRFREIEKVGNEIKKLVIRDNVHYNDIAILTNNPPAYADTIRQIFHEMDIPFYNSKDEPLKSNPVIIFIAAIIKNVLKDRAVNNVGLIGLVQSNYMGNPSYKEIADLAGFFKSYFQGGPVEWEKEIEEKLTFYREMRRLNFLGEEETDLTLDEISRRIAQLERMKGVLLKLVRTLFSIPEPFTIDGFIQWLASLITELGVKAALGELNGDESLLSAKDYTAFRKLNDTLFSIKKSLRIYGKETFGPEEFYYLFDNLIQEISYRYQYYPLDSVRVLTPFDARESSFSTVFLIGLNEGEFPGKTAASLLDSKEKNDFNRAARNLVLDEEQGKSDSEKLNYAVSLSRARDRVYLSHTPFDESGAEILPSFFLTITLQKNGMPPEEIKKIRDLEDEMIPSESWMDLYDLQTLVMNDSSRLGNTLPSELAKEFSFLESSRKMKDYSEKLDSVNHFFERLDAGQNAGETEDSRFGQIYFGNLDLQDPSPDGIQNKKNVADRIKNLTLSSSLLETFGNCRYQFFLKYILNIREKKYPSQKIQSTVKGRFYHSALRAYCEATKDKSGAEIESRIEEYYGLLDKMIDRVYLEFLNKEGEKDLFTLEKEYYREVLKNFILFDAQTLRAGQYLPSELEYAIDGPAPQGLAAPETNITLKGSIDRVDEIQSSPEKSKISRRILDYKSGSVKHIADDLLIPLKVFQGFIYAKAYGQATGKSVDEIAYVSIEKGEDKIASVLPLKIKKEAVISNFSEIWEQKSKEIKTFFEMTNEGNLLSFSTGKDFSEDLLDFYRKLDPQGEIQFESNSKCNYCPYIDACQRREKKKQEW